MQENLKAFQLKINGKILDYRLGENVDLTKVKSFFEKSYTVIKIWSGGRHILGILKKYNKKYFLKLSTSQGISYLTQNEYSWNSQFNKLIPRKTSKFWVPKNVDCGFYEGKLFYLITDYLHEEFISDQESKYPLDQITNILEFSELIQNLKLSKLRESENTNNHQLFFLNKTKSWYQDIPLNIKGKYKISNLMNRVESKTNELDCKPRHGDFAPWHLIKLTNNTTVLIDGEHALAEGVEYYDIAYFIQRVFSVLCNPDLAGIILSRLIKKGYDIDKLITVLSARAIGGYLDESLAKTPDYHMSNQFQKWVLNIR